jgi:ribosomal protein L37AE/L43A
MSAHSIVCPVCRNRTVERIRRQWWMRLFPYSRYYFCSHCDTSFWNVFQVLSLKIQ